MSRISRLLFATALAVGVADFANAGQLLNATQVAVPLAPADTAIRSLTAGFDIAGDFDTPSKALGLAYGDGGIFASFGDNSVRRYNGAGLVTASLVSEFGQDFGALAFGNDTVFVGYRSDSTFGVGFYDESFGYQDYFEVPEAVNGLAFGDDSLFVTYGDTLAKYDLDGNLLGSASFAGFGVGFLAGSLAYGDGVLFMEYTQFVPLVSETHGIGYLNPGTLGFNSFIETGEDAFGLAYGDGRLFASYDFALKSYDLTGDQIGDTITGIAGIGLQNGALAFRNSAPCNTRICDDDGPRGAVPEPSTWAMLILGFGLTGAIVRRRRPVLGTA